MSMGDFPESLSQAMLVGILFVVRLGVRSDMRSKMDGHRPCDHRFQRQHLYEEFTMLAETRLAQNTLNYLNIA